MDGLSGLSRRKDAAYDAERAAYAARNTRNARIAALKGMLDEGFPESLTLSAAYQDLLNDGAPMSERVGRGMNK